VSDEVDDDDYKVGYGRPPLRTRFKKGKSGNPKGKRKKSPDLSEIIGEELESSRYVEIDNKREKLSITRLLVKQYIRMALKGNIKAILSLLELAAERRKATAKLDAQSKSKYPTKEERSKMTDQELTDLYMQTLKAVNREE
jgi:Family of unknown function (DUF5681)